MVGFNSVLVETRPKQRDRFSLLHCVDIHRLTFAGKGVSVAGRYQPGDSGAALYKWRQVFWLPNVVDDKQRLEVFNFVREGGSRGIDVRKHGPLAAQRLDQVLNAASQVSRSLAKGDPQYPSRERCFYSRVVANSGCECRLAVASSSSERRLRRYPDTGRGLVM